MGRKLLRELDSHRFSVDIGGNNKKMLDLLADRLNMKYSPTINHIISTFCVMTPEVKHAFLEFCSTQYTKISKAQRCEGAFGTDFLEKQKEQYLEIAKLINDGKELSIKENEPMKKIKLKDGYLIIPSDWIVLNEDEGHLYSYAGVIECRNSEKYSIPHFVFLNEHKYGGDYTNSLYEKIHQMCIDTWPDFKEIINRQVNPIPDPDLPGNYLNMNEFMSAPTIGYFHLPESTENKNPVCGAMIVRTK